MSDLIDRQAAIDILTEMQVLCISQTSLIESGKMWHCGVALAKEHIKKLPSAQPERKNGEMDTEA